MSAPYIIPFNNQPINTGAGSSTYTVPSGKYARLTFTCTATCFITFASSTSMPKLPTTTSDSNVTTGYVWLKEADAITVSSGVPSSSASGAGDKNLNGTSTASILLNGTAFATAIAHASTSWSANDGSATLSGTTSVNFMYEEYNLIS